MSADEKETQDLKLLDDDDPSILSQQIFQILKEAVLSKGEPSPGASAKRIDSLLKANVGLVTEEGGAITSKGFSFVVGMMLVQTAIQLPAEKDKQHERLGEVILALTRIPERMDGDQIFAWSKLPFIEGEFEDRWHQIGPGGGSREQDWRRLNSFMATLVGLNSQSSSPSYQVQRWIRWGWYPFNTSTGGSYRHRHTQQISENPIAGKHYKANLEMTALWIDKAGEEIYRQSKDSKSEEGGGLLWRETLKDGGRLSDRWEFWKERLRVIGEFEGSDQDIKTLIKKMQRKMGEIENEL